MLTAQLKLISTEMCFFPNQCYSSSIALIISGLFWCNRVNMLDQVRTVHNQPNASHFSDCFCYYLCEREIRRPYIDSNEMHCVIRFRDWSTVKRSNAFSAAHFGNDNIGPLPVTPDKWSAIILEPAYFCPLICAICTFKGVCVRDIPILMMVWFPLSNIVGKSELRRRIP